jgi:hypothetical protein
MFCKVVKTRSSSPTARPIHRLLICADATMVSIEWNSSKMHPRGSYCAAMEARLIECARLPRPSELACGFAGPCHGAQQATRAYPAARPALPPSEPSPPPWGRFLLRAGPAAQLHRKHRRGPGRRRVASGGYHVRPHCPRATYPFTSYIGGVQSPLAPCGRACIDSRAARPSR